MFICSFLTWFGSSEGVQAVCVGVSGRIQCEEDALSHPTQVLSQRGGKGIYAQAFLNPQQAHTHLHTSAFVLRW